MRIKAFFTVIGMIVAAYFFSVFLEEKVEAKYNTETAADAPEETGDSTPAG